MLRPLFIGLIVAFIAIHVASANAGRTMTEMGDLNQVVTEMKRFQNMLLERIDALEKKANEYANASAFSAKLTTTFPAVSGEAIVFDDVILNKGQGYNTSTGVFIAPSSGVYSFNLVLLVRINDELLDVDLQANHNTLHRLTTMEKEREDQVSLSVTAPLQAGDEVNAVVKYCIPPLAA